MSDEKVIYTFEDQELEEVEVDENPPESDTESIWTDIHGTGEEYDEDGSMDIDGVEKVLAVDLSQGSFNGHGRESVYCVSIHPQHPNMVVTGGGDDCAYIWTYEKDLVEGTKSLITVVHALKGHTDTVTTVGFNYDGTLALTGSYDGTIRIWNVETGNLNMTLDGPEDIDWAEWHNKGNAIIAGSKDGTVWMWLAHNGQCVQVFAGHDGGVSSGCFSLDGKLVFSGGEDGTVRVWNPKTGACKLKFEGAHSGHEGTVTCLVSSLDGDMVLSGSVDGKVRLYQVSGKKVLHTFIHCTPESLTDAKNQNQSKESSTEFLNGDIDNSDDIMEEELEATLSVECVGFCNGDLKWIASGGMDSNLKIWDMTTGSCRNMCKHNGSVVALRWHSKVPIVATACLDNDLRIWDARNGSLLSLLTGHNDIILSLDMKPLSQDEETVNKWTDIIVTVSDDGTAKVFPINVTALLSRT